MGALVEALSPALDLLAAGAISSNTELDEPERAAFLLEPDDPAFHEPTWHQFGIVTHNRRAAAAFSSDVPAYLRTWGVDARVDAYLDEQIDGMPRAELLEVALLFHDIGKFAARRTVEKNGGRGFTFEGHERASGRLLRSGLFTFMGSEFGMTAEQRQYIAQCAERHYDLGRLRGVAKAGPGYTMRFVESDAFAAAAQAVAAAQPSLVPEIGLLFLADNYSKTEVRMEGVESDADIEARTPAAVDELAARGLNPRLIRAVRQLPVNVAVARRYLQLWGARS